MKAEVHSQQGNGPHSSNQQTNSSAAQDAINTSPLAGARRRGGEEERSGLTRGRGELRFRTISCASQHQIIVLPVVPAAQQQIIVLLLALLSRALWSHRYNTISRSAGIQDGCSGHTPVYTCTTHLYTPVQNTCTSHVYNRHLHTCTTHLCNTPVSVTSTTNLYNTPVSGTSTRHLYNTPLQHTCTSQINIPSPHRTIQRDHYCRCKVWI